jgi:hypothetical protein
MRWLVQIENPKQYNAAAEFNRTIIAKLANKKGFHAETAISAASRMAGTQLLRSSGLPLAQFTPGTPIFFDVVDEQGQQVLGLVDRALASLGVPFDARQVDYDLSDHHNPQIDLMQTQALLDEPFRAITHKYGLSEAEAASALAISTAVLIQNCSGLLNPHVGYALAAYGMVEGSKTVPFEGSIQ